MPGAPFNVYSLTGLVFVEAIFGADGISRQWSQSPAGSISAEINVIGDLSPQDVEDIPREAYGEAEQRQAPKKEGPGIGALLASLIEADDVDAWVKANKRAAKALQKDDPAGYTRVNAAVEKRRAELAAKDDTDVAAIEDEERAAILEAEADAIHAQHDE